jgi:hypothetical protein
LVERLNEFDTEALAKMIQSGILRWENCDVSRLSLGRFANFLLGFTNLKARGKMALLAQELATGFQHGKRRTFAQCTHKSTSNSTLDWWWMPSWTSVGM